MFRHLFFDFVPELLGELYFRFGINLVPEDRYEVDLDGIRKVCVFATSGVGNLIMLIPLLKGLRDFLPDAKVYIVVSSEAAAEVIEGQGLVDEIIISGKGTKRSLFRKLRDEWFDATIAATHFGYMRAKEAFKTGARVRIGFRYSDRQRLDGGFFLTHPATFESKKHEVEQNLQLLRAMGISAKPDLHYRIAEADCKFADDFTLKFGLRGDFPLIGFHTGSASDPIYRCWQKEKFAQLGDRLCGECGAKVLIVGGASEEKFVADIISLMCYKPVSAVSKTTLGQTAALIDRCDLFISNDSGPMHLSAALKIPTIGIFGPTDYVAHAPYGKECYLVRSSLPCSPCHHPHSDGYGCGEVDCFRFIGVSEVFKVAKQILEKGILYEKDR